MGWTVRVARRDRWLAGGTGTARRNVVWLCFDRPEARTLLERLIAHVSKKQPALVEREREDRMRVATERTELFL